MQTAGQRAFSEQPELMELFHVLEENKMTKELREVETLVKYLESMEEQFGQVLEDLQEVRTQLNQLEDRGIGATTMRIVERAEDKVKEIGIQFTKVRNNLIQSARYAVAVFREKGTEALKSAVSAMKIPTVLSALKESLHSGMESMDRCAGKMDDISDEFHAVGGHMKNIGRILIGKERKEPVRQNPDKGVLMKMQTVLLACGRYFSEMERKTENTLRRVEQFNSMEKKPSVKAEIKQIKSEKSKKLQVQPMAQEKIR